MIHKANIAVICLVALSLFSALWIACGTQDEDGKPHITIGFISDFSGPASQALRVLAYNQEDVIRYTNEEDPIPGVELELITYDCKYDPARDLTGYEWLKDKGAQVIHAPIAGTAEALLSFAEADRIPLMCSNPSLPLVEPPGWQFTPVPLTGMLVKTLLEWVSTQWDYDQGKPKIATVGWKVASQEEKARGAREYCQDHRDKFEYLGDALAPSGTMTWSGEIEAVKDCDFLHVATAGPGAATFMEQFRMKGYQQRIISGYDVWAFQKLMEDKAGEEALDGSWMASPIGNWGDPSPLWQFLDELLNTYRPGQAEAIKRDWGPSYPAGWVPIVMVDIIRQAVEQVGADGFDGQAFYDTALGWSKTYDGFDEWTFADGKCYASRHVKVYEYQSDIGELVQITGWMPIIED